MAPARRCQNSRPISAPAPTSHVVHSNSRGRPAISPMPTLRLATSICGTSSASACAKACCTSDSPAGSLNAPLPSPCAMLIDSTPNTSSHAKKYRTLPPVRRSIGTMSNRIAKNAVSDSAGNVSTSAGLTSSTRSNVRSSPCTICATTPTTRPTAITSANTTMWLAHFATR
jgi:hypothetical protein